MNSRRKFLTFLGIAPVAVATGAVAAVHAPKTEVVKLDIDMTEFRKTMRAEFWAAWRDAQRARLL